MYIMFGLNYTGLQKRDTYDEIVQIVEGGGGKIVPQSAGNANTEQPVHETN